jgi:protein pelota
VSGRLSIRNRSRGNNLKILEKHLKKGFVKVAAESLDDLWHLYNIIYPGDQVYSRTTREIKMDELYSRPKEGRRISVFLGVRVEKVFWDRSLNRLRVHGVIFDVPERVGGRGTHHTLNVVVDKPLTIVKAQWLKHQVDRLERASHVEAPLVTVMSIDDEEYCVAILRQYGVEVKAEKRTRLPGKLEPEKRDEAVKSFFKSALQALQETWSGVRSPIVVLGPGFVKNDFARYVREKASDVAEAIVEVKGVNSAGVAGIHEALRSGVLGSTLKNIRIAEETRLVEEALAKLGQALADVTYGLGEVARAAEYGAIKRLLVADTVLRDASDQDRTAVENIMRAVEAKGGQVTVVSTEQEAGVKLQSLGGIAALLRFPIG